jgi:hypothetical protein
MLYDSQKYWGSGLCTSSRILKTRKQNDPENGSVSVKKSIFRDIVSGFLEFLTMGKVQ